MIWKMLVAVMLVVGCTDNQPSPHRIFVDTPSQRLFDSSVAESRRVGLEMGGCFRVLPARRVLIVYDAVVSDTSRDENSVYLRCADSTTGLWHTHWDIGDRPCVPSSTDVSCMQSHGIGIVVCGKGRDSLTAFGPDTSMTCVP
jgi:hypothetical protein